MCAAPSPPPMPAPPPAPPAPPPAPPPPAVSVIGQPAKVASPAGQRAARRRAAAGPSQLAIRPAGVPSGGGGGAMSAPSSGGGAVNLNIGK
jgi:hypothetical protein